MGPWAIGYAIGIGVVLVVVVVLLLMIVGARRTLANAQTILSNLEETRETTAALWAVETTNHTAARIVQGAVRAREALEREGRS
jgi:hypothetical protein